MYKCFNCNNIFDEPDFYRTTCEDYYGVGSMFNDRHSMKVEVCPYCRGEYYDEYYECEEEEEEDDGE